LLQWKAETDFSDKGFEKLLKIIKNKLLKDNDIPDNTYEGKKGLCPLGLEVQKIHAYINDCILYRGGSMRIWKHARYALQCSIRSDQMTLVILRASPLGRGFLPRSCCMLL
jgi:hypothetical protein